MIRLDRDIYRIERFLDEDAKVYMRGKRADKDTEWMINDLLAAIKIMNIERRIWIWLAFITIIIALVVLANG